MAVKAQRDHMIVRTALTRETLRDTLPIQAEARYVLIGADGQGRGGRRREPADGRALCRAAARRIAAGTIHGLGGGVSRWKHVCARISGVSPSARTELGEWLGELTS